MINVCAISDLHGTLPEINPCELLLICGDIVPLSAQGSTLYTSRWYKRVFKTWAENLPCDKVVFIAGNHELHLENPLKDWKKHVLQFSKNGDFIKEYSSTLEASQLTKIGKSSIGNCLVHLSKSAGGFIWIYKEEYENSKQNPFCGL